MRGKSAEERSLTDDERITPADAGKTLSVRASRAGLRDHPRGCGENSMSLSSRTTKIGSPPRMRGKHIGGRQIEGEYRITPADAGKTHFIRFSSPLMRDHPRGCGENHFWGEYFSEWLGSPPRMRGKRENGQMADGDGGITPADAGKTCPISYANCIR